MLTTFRIIANCRKLITTRCFFSVFSHHSKLSKEPYKVKNSLISSNAFDSYYKDKLENLDHESKSIIIEMASPTCDRQLVLKKIENYLDFLKKRTPQGLLILITALDSFNSTFEMKDLSRQICQYILRYESISVFQLDEKSLFVLTKALLKHKKNTIQKIKQQVIKAKIIQLLKNNFDIIRDQYVHTYLTSLLELTDQSTTSDSKRAIALAELFQNKITQYLKQLLAETDRIIKTEEKISVYLRSVLEFYFAFSPKHNESVETFYKITSIFLNHYFNCKRFFYYSFYIYFPYEQKNSQGQYFKDLILQDILSHQHKTLSGPNQDWHQVKFCYSIISFTFYKFMNEVQFRYHQDLNYLLKEDLQKPELHPIFWKKYQQNTLIFNNANNILTHIIKHIYPEHYVPLDQEKPPIIKPPPHAENQVKLRMTMALEKLGLKKQAEIMICGRFVDFLLEDNIIIEIDGDYHFNVHKMEYNENTQFRNLHLLLSGYRLILLNIFEYNENRYPDKLSELVKKKLDFMKKTKAMIVI